jgi:hypothetical protein
MKSRRRREVIEDIQYAAFWLANEVHSLPPGRAFLALLGEISDEAIDLAVRRPVKSKSQGNPARDDYSSRGKEEMRRGQGGPQKWLSPLEAHLEDFITRNWSKISWGAALELYQDGEQTGQQFPAGTWSIDFLAVDRKKNELVVTAKPNPSTTLKVSGLAGTVIRRPAKVTPVGQTGLHRMLRPPASFQ